MIGKDFVAGYIALSFFLHPQMWFDEDYNEVVRREKRPEEPLKVRVVSTSVRDDHLRVLWGEIDRYIRTAAVPLTADKGGPLVYNHHEIRKVVDGQLVKDSYLLGQVSEKGEGMSGHHAPYSLFIIDEASGVDQVVYNHGIEWSKKRLIFGNPNPCPPQHFFKKNWKGGDLVKAA